MSAFNIMPACTQALTIPYEAECSTNRRALFDYPEAPLIICREKLSPEYKAYLNIHGERRPGEAHHLRRIHNVRLQMRSGNPNFWVSESSEKIGNHEPGDQIHLEEIFPTEAAQPVVKDILDLRPLAEELLKNASLGLMFHTISTPTDRIDLHTDDKDSIGRNGSRFGMQLVSKSNVAHRNGKNFCANEDDMGMLSEGDLFFMKGNFSHRAYVPRVGAGIQPRFWYSYFPVPLF